MNGEHTHTGTLCVVGLGYVGLTLAASFAQAGRTVVGIDRDEKIIESLRAGTPHFHEPGLRELILEQKNNLSFQTAIVDGSASVYIIAVGTSIMPDATPDYSVLDAAVGAIAAVLKTGDLVILRSTVTIGTTRTRVIPLLEARSGLSRGKDFGVTFAPERTIEGKALPELRSLPQVVGGFSEADRRKVGELFSELTPHIVYVDSLEEAEMIKLVSNAYRDLVFGFANTLALIAAEHNVDINTVIRSANHGYPRNQIPLPSPGVGGYCLTKDPLLLIQSTVGEKYGALMRDARVINAHMPSHVVDVLEAYDVTEEGKQRKIAILGLAFKGNPPTSDVRFSPSLDLITALHDRGYQHISAYDPLVNDDVFDIWGVERKEKPEDVTNDADILIFMHMNDHYQSFNLAPFLARTGTRLVVDPWALFEKRTFNDVPGCSYATLSFASFKVNQ